MFPLVLLISLMVEAEPRTAKDSAKPSRKEAPAPAAKAGDAEVRRLIKQLGAESYAQREAASKGLAALGEKAVSALKEARNHPDAEVKRRVARLLSPLEAQARKREIEAIKKSKMCEIVAIKKSKLTPNQKGRKLGELIGGMSKQEVKRVLGPGSSEYETMESPPRECIAYKQYELLIVFGSKRKETGWQPGRVQMIFFGWP
jgi:hypothetical protein